MMAEQAHIETIHAEDVEKARDSIRTCCERVNSHWVPRDAIADALLLEYIEQIRQTALEDHAIRCLGNAIALLKVGKSPAVPQ